MHVVLRLFSSFSPGLVSIFLVEAFSSLLYGVGAAFLVLRLGLFVAMSLWSILDESTWGCVTHVGG